MIRIPKTASYDVQVAFGDIATQLNNLEKRVNLLPLGATPEEVSNLRMELAKVAKSVDRPVSFDTRNVFRGAGPAHALGHVPNPGPYASIDGGDMALLGNGAWGSILSGLVQVVPRGTGGSSLAQRVVNVLASLAVLNSISADVVTARLFEGRASKTSLWTVGYSGAPVTGKNSNLGAGETNLSGHTFTMPGGYLQNGDAIVLRVILAAAANANAKTVRLDIAGQKFTLWTSAANVASHIGSVLVHFNRRTSTTGGLSGHYFKDAAAGAVPTPVVVNVGMSSLNWDIPQTVMLTAQGGGDNDLIVAESLWYPLLGFGSIA